MATWSTPPILGSNKKAKVPSDVASITSRFSSMNVSVQATNRCTVCKVRPRFMKKGRTYPTCGLTCASKLASNGWGASSDTLIASPRSSFVQSKKPLCVICRARPICRDYLTCGLTCAEILCRDGGDGTMCQYCHRAPRATVGGKSVHRFCGTPCAEKSKVACLLCRTRPRNGTYDFCGNTCRIMAFKLAPLIRSIPRGDSTFETVEQNFRKSWRSTVYALPKIKKIFKLIENDEFYTSYNQYKAKVGNEVVRYHGTQRECKLGNQSEELCSSWTCQACNIVKLSFEISLGDPTAAFGKAIYTSSASNKAYRQYCGTSGAMIVAKVALGKVKQVKKFEEVKSCPRGFDSVVYDRQGGDLNETIVYTNDAIRPTYLIIF